MSFTTATPMLNKKKFKQLSCTFVRKRKMLVLTDGMYLFILFLNESIHPVHTIAIAIKKSAIFCYLSVQLCTKIG
jgi:hypothetical protein